MLEDLDAAIERFQAYSYSDFAYLDEWFGDILEHHGIRQDGFDRDFIVHLAYAGWFIFAVGELMPKLHRARCFIELDDWDAPSWLRSIQHPPESHWHDGQIKFRPFARQLKRLFQPERRFALSCNADFRLALENTNRFHGYSWIAAELTEILVDLHDRPAHVEGTVVQAVSWELRDADGVMLAADIGYAVGSVYSSMSGYSDRRYPSIGIIQLVAQAMMMKDAGLRLWDLGEQMSYKLGLGAEALPPAIYLPRVRHHREAVVSLPRGEQLLSEMDGFRAMLRRVQPDHP